MRDPLLLAVGAAVGAAAVATVAYVQRGAESDDVPTRRPSRLSDLVDDAEDAVDYLNWMTVSIATRLDRGFKPRSSEMPDFRESINAAVTATSKLADAVDATHVLERETSDAVLLASMGRSAI